MNLRKGKTTALSSPARREFKAMHFMGEVKEELHRVEWTSKGELKSYTKMVLLSTLIFGMLVYGIDLMMQGVLGVAHWVMRLIG